MDGWMDGWVGGGKSRFKDCLQQSKRSFQVSYLDLFYLVLLVPYFLKWNTKNMLPNDCFF